MNIAKDRVVSITYTLTDAKGRQLDSSDDTGPLSYLHGHENIIPGLEKALDGKNEGEELKVSVPCKEAYGERDEKLVVNVPRASFQGVEEIVEGMQFHAETAEGTHLVTVTKVGTDTVTVDANHPLAGEDLNFDVKVVAIRAASAEELEHGHPHIEGGCGCGGDCDDDCDCEEEGCGSSGCGCGCH